MGEFDEHVTKRIRLALESLGQSEAADAYVVSLFVYDEEDDPQFPTLTVSVNTETQVRFATNPPADFVKPSPWWTPSGEREARWNYAFWTQSPLVVIADSSSDPLGAQLRKAWFESLRIPVDVDWDALRDDEEDDLARRFTGAFVDLCVSTVQELHRSGVVESVFGRPIPLVIHELEYYDAIARQNVLANGPELVSGLVTWIRGD